MNFISDRINMSFYNENLNTPLICIPISLEDVKKENDLIYPNGFIFTSKFQMSWFDNQFIQDKIFEELFVKDNIKCTVKNHFNIENFKLHYGDIMYVADCSGFILPNQSFVRYARINQYSHIRPNDEVDMKKINETIKWFKIYYQPIKDK